MVWFLVVRRGVVGGLLAADRQPVGQLGVDPEGGVLGEGAPRVHGGWYQPLPVPLQQFSA